MNRVIYDIKPEEQSDDGSVLLSGCSFRIHSLKRCAKIELYIMLKWFGSVQEKMVNVIERNTFDQTIQSNVMKKTKLYSIIWMYCTK